jgi:ATP-dependent Lhr-like helicase
VLQEGRVGDRAALSAWGGLPLLDDTSPAVLAHLIGQGMLESEDGMLFIGPTAERLFGRRYFRELTSSFTADPEFTVLYGRTEIGAVHPLAVTAPVAGESLRLLLAGRSWDVEHIDWRRRRCYVVPAAGAGRARWQGSGSPLSFAMVRAQRDVVLGAEPPATVSARATEALRRLRTELGSLVAEGGTVLRRVGSQVTWWTWAGGRTNATLAAALPAVVEPAGRLHDRRLLRDGVDTAGFADAVRRARDEPMPAPAVAEEAVRGLKFADALPAGLAARTLAERLADVPGAERVLAERRVDVR